MQIVSPNLSGEIPFAFMERTFCNKTVYTFRHFHHIEFHITTRIQKYIFGMVAE